jgi:hypothetical protein
MVWAMTMPSDFGDFFPDGDYVGFRENLHKYFAENMTAEQRAVFGGNRASYVSFVVEKYHRELGSEYSRDKPRSSAIESHEPPACFETEKRYTSLGSLIKLTDRILAVDEVLKNIVEKLEPEKHQFFPIKIIMPKGEVYPKQYFTMRIGQWLDSFSPADSKPEVLRKDGDRGRYQLLGPTKPYISGLAVSKSKCGTAHLWKERFLSGGPIMLSDALQTEIANVGLHLPKHFRVMEV